MWITRLREYFREHRETRQALRELRAMRNIETRDILLDPNTNPIDQAGLCLRAGDIPSAIRHWKDGFARFPDHVERSHEALRLAVSLRLLDEAEMLARRGQARRPTDPVFYEVEADAVDWRGDHVKALALWTAITKRFPDRPAAYVRTALCLGQVGRDHEAGPYLARAVERFPDIMDCRHAYAHLAERDGQLDAALERWTWLEEKFPAFPDGVLGAARVLERLGRPDDAEARLLAARHRHTSNADFMIALAHHAARRGAWEDADKDWATIRARWPRRREGFDGGVEALSALNRTDAAEALRASAP
jgi:tetratricopeptide (TPR) repeat protein